MLLQTVRKDRETTVILGTLHGHQTNIVVWKSWVIAWMNGDWDVKGDEHAVHVRAVVDQLVRWYLNGTFRPRNDETAGAGIFFRESNKAADTHANWLMDNGGTGPVAQWRVQDLLAKLRTTRHIILTFDGAGRGSGLGAAAWILWMRDVKRRSLTVERC